MGNHQERRRQIVVDRGLQGRILFTTAWAPCLCLALSSVLLGLFCGEIYYEAMRIGVELTGMVPALIVLLSLLLVAMVYMLWSALAFSHGIAGAMVNVGNTLDSFREGDLAARVQLREGDYLQTTADHVNGFLDWLEEHPPSNARRSPLSDPAKKVSRTVATKYGWPAQPPMSNEGTRILGPGPNPRIQRKGS